MKITLIAALCCCAFFSIMLVGAGAAAAREVDRAPRAHAASCSDHTWMAVPSGEWLWIRFGPSTSSAIGGAYSYGTEFLADCTGRGWLQIIAGQFIGEWVNATYAKSE